MSWNVISIWNFRNRWTWKTSPSSSVVSTTTVRVDDVLKRDGNGIFVDPVLSDAMGIVFDYIERYKLSFIGQFLGNNSPEETRRVLGELHVTLWKAIVPECSDEELVKIFKQKVDDLKSIQRQKWDTWVKDYLLSDTCKRLLELAIYSQEIFSRTHPK